jgi:hypothetical protein
MFGSHIFRGRIDSAVALCAAFGLSERNRGGNTVNKYTTGEIRERDTEGGLCTVPFTVLAKDERPGLPSIPATAPARTTRTKRRRSMIIQSLRAKRPI